MIFKSEKEKDEVKMLSPLVWAYIGDAVYELWVRVKLVDKTNAKPHKLHVESIQKVSAKAQSDLLEELEDTLTEDEKDIVRRGRNTKNYHVAKNATQAEYARSTGFEALIGYLFLMNEDKRLAEIIDAIYDIYTENNEEF